ncbi:MAG: nucleotidyltransferase substrate binding protein [Oscillospiraceae bacterium]|jgi:nucleotidyltransferase substrate binding protein (TIGR01987 family)|nr:nucleotidyltransferase substrate binding protein [Oscillospiraceae bacterium]
MAELDLTALRKAAEAFGHALEYARKIENKPPEQREFFEMEFTRAAVIQHFEFAYEICWKTMKRYIEMDIGAEADILTRRDLFRQAVERRIISDFDSWLEFHTARNRTSHVYDQSVAEQVYSVAKSFGETLKVFLSTMETRIRETRI